MREVEFEDTLTDVPRVIDMRYKIPCPAAIFPTIMESDIHAEEENADTRIEADAVFKFVPNADPIIRMELLPEVEKAVGFASLTKNVVLDDNTCCSSEHL